MHRAPDTYIADLAAMVQESIAWRASIGSNPTPDGWPDSRAGRLLELDCFGDDAFRDELCNRINGEADTFRVTWMWAGRATILIHTGNYADALKAAEKHFGWWNQCVWLQGPHRKKALLSKTRAFREGSAI